MADAAQPPSNIPEYSIGQITKALQQTVEGTFGRVRLRGEITELRRPSSGHLYFTLADQEAKIAAVCFRGSAARLKIKPQDGMEVVATGKLTIYAGQSRYQILVDQMDLAGEGALLKLLEDRRKALAAEGLFDEGRKRPLPFLPRVIAVVTSPTGSVIQDILHRLEDRLPTRVQLWGVPVQGETAPAKIAAALRAIEALPQTGGRYARPDLVILARGGGSLEDLMAFNEEVVVRAVADLRIPVISGVGHETDTTLVDFAADYRAPTPTGAAERAVPVRTDLLARLTSDQQRLTGVMARTLEAAQLRLAAQARGLSDPSSLLDRQDQRLDDLCQRAETAALATLRTATQALEAGAARLLHPRHLVAQRAQRLEGLDARLSSRYPQPLLIQAQEKVSAVGERMARAVRAPLDRAGERLQSRAHLLESLSHKSVLQRGFVLLRDADDQPVTSAAAVDRVAKAEFHDGTVALGGPGAAPCLGGAGAAPSANTAPKQGGAQRRRAAKDQGSLF